MLFSMSEASCLCRDSPPAWQCEVLFCDDTSRFDSLNKLTERHSELAGRRQQLQAKLDAANQVKALESLHSPHCCAALSDGPLH